jgi:hypothetical protein
MALVLVFTQAFAPIVGVVVASEIPPTRTAPAANPTPIFAAVLLKKFMYR